MSREVKVGARRTDFLGLTNSTAANTSFWTKGGGQSCSDGGCSDGGAGRRDARVRTGQVQERESLGVCFEREEREAELPQAVAGQATSSPSTAPFG